MSRRRGRANRVTVIYWRDIPAQVTASDGNDTEKALLEPRFQHAIDRAAAVAGLTETDAYVAQWRSQTEPLTADPATAATDRATAMQRAYDRDRLERLVAAGGADSSAADGANSSATDGADSSATDGADSSAADGAGSPDAVDTDNPASGDSPDSAITEGDIDDAVTNSTSDPH